MRGSAYKQLGFHTRRTRLLLGRAQSGISDERGVVFLATGLFFQSYRRYSRTEKRGSSLTEDIVKRFGASSRLVLAITPEGTRKGTAKWRHGFLYIAKDAGIPLLLGAIDYKNKTIEITTEFKPTDNIEADMRAIKDFYSKYNAKYPEKFITDYE